MKFYNGSGICCILLLLGLSLGGCADKPPENILENEQVLVLSEEDIRGKASDDIVSGEILDPEPEENLPEADSFLEQGMRYARSKLNATEQIWYDDIEEILGNYQLQIALSKEGLEAGLTEDNIDRIFQCVLNDHPELFYVDGYSYTKYTRYGHDNEIDSIVFSGRYSMEREKAVLRQSQIQEAVSRILAGIDTNAEAYEKVKYVYEILIKETDYQLDAPDNQNIYSVFVNHLSVCQGYAKATQYLLNRLGVECVLVLGTVNNGEGHAWNLVDVDGDYYYVDTTWGDASYQPKEDGFSVTVVQPEINYDYLNVTTEELVRTHTIGGEVPMPVCSAIAANYYVREGALFTDYDREQMASLFERKLSEGMTDVTIKCSGPDCYRKVTEALIDRQDIFYYLSGMGDTVAYIQNDTQLSLTFWVTNE